MNPFEKRSYTLAKKGRGTGKLPISYLAEINRRSEEKDKY